MENLQKHYSFKCCCFSIDFIDLIAKSLSMFDIRFGFFKIDCLNQQDFTLSQRQATDFMQNLKALIDIKIVIIIKIGYTAIGVGIDFKFIKDDQY